LVLELEVGYYSVEFEVFKANVLVSEFNTYSAGFIIKRSFEPSLYYFLADAAVPLVKIVARDSLR